HRQAYVFGTCFGGGMMDELLIDTGQWRSGCAAAVHFESSWCYYWGPESYDSFMSEYVNAASDKDKHTTAALFNYAYDNDPYATDGMGAPWGEGIFYTEEVEHPYFVGDNLDLKLAYWMGDGTPGCDPSAGVGPDIVWSDPDNWNDGHMPSGISTARVRFYGEGGRAIITDGLHLVGSFIVDYGPEVEPNVGVGSWRTGMHLTGVGGLMTQYTTIGREGCGYFVQKSNSTHDVMIELTLGRREYSYGEYCLEDGLLRVDGNVLVGDAGWGHLDIQGGTLRARGMRVGVTGNGEVHHRGGMVCGPTADDLDLTIAAGEFGVGEYTIYPGTGAALLRVNDLTIGDHAVTNGKFIQKGGNVYVGELFVGKLGRVYTGYLMEGGFLQVNSGHVGWGAGTDGEFVQSGGTVRCLDDFGVGARNGAAGTLHMTGGTFDIRDHTLHIGIKETGGGEGTGTLIIDGGLIIANTLHVAGITGSTIQGGDETMGTLRVNRFYGLGGYIDLGAHLQIGHAGGDGEGRHDVHGPDAGLSVAGDLTVGYDAPGLFVQGPINDKSVIVSGDLRIGDRPEADGNYSMISSYGMLDAFNVFVGCDGNGTLLQTRGSVTAENRVYIGSGAGSTGLYRLDGFSADVYATEVIVGRWGTGTFQHLGGYVQLSDGVVTIGEWPGGEGTYELADDVVYASREYVGKEGKGTFRQTGGLNNVGTLFVAWDSDVECTYTMEAGTLSADDAYVGDSGPGRFVQTTGWVRVEGTLALGRLSDGNGTYEMGGGSLSAGELRIGMAGEGRFDWTAGDLDCAATYIGEQGRMDVRRNWTITNYLETIGVVEAYENRLTIEGLSVKETDLDVMMLAGRVHAGSMVIGDAGSPLVGQGDDATVEIDGELCVGKQAGSDAWFTFSGDLQAGSAVVGSSGTGTVYQAGGTTTIDGSLTLGLEASGNGWYQIREGSLSVDSMTVGQNGSGTFVQGPEQWDSGYTPEVHVTGQLTIGLGGDAWENSYTLWAGLLEADEINVGGSGTGWFTVEEGTATAQDLWVRSGSGMTINRGTVVADWFNVSSGGFFDMPGYAGVLRVNSLNGVEPVGWTGSLHLGHSGGTGKASYSVGPGEEVSIGGYFIIGWDGNATLTQTGGTVAPDSGLGVGIVRGGAGTYLLSGDGEVTTDQTNVGQSGLGHFVQDGGTHTVYTLLAVGMMPGGRGTYELKSGYLEAWMMAVGYAGSGSFIQTGGDAMVMDMLLLGYEPGGYGRYDMVDGQATVGQLYAGVMGPGHVFLRGGSFAVDWAAYVGSYGGAGSIYLYQGSMEVYGELAMQPLTPESSCRGKLFYSIHGTQAGTDYGQVVGMEVKQYTPATLGGTLVADFTNYCPSTGDEFVLLENFDIYGTFDAVCIRGLQEGFQYDVDYSGGRVTLTALTDGVLDESVSSTFMVGVTGVGGSGGTDGGVDANFASTGGGPMRTEYRWPTFENMRGEVPEITEFEPAGSQRGQYWRMDYDGEFSGDVALRFYYDDSLLRPEEDER
ncbi:MAG: hypothetical protein WBF17_21695, partial [Phycisphaerae bacterium]